MPEIWLSYSYKELNSYHGSTGELMCSWTLVNLGAGQWAPVYSAPVILITTLIQGKTSDLSCCCGKHLLKNNLRKSGFSSAIVQRCIGQHGEKDRAARSWDSWSHWVWAQEARSMERSYSASSLLFIPSGTLVHGVMLPRFRVGDFSFWLT